MKKVMIMTNALYHGGAEKILQTLLNNLDYSKFDVTLYSMHPRELDGNIFTKKDRFKYKAVFDEYKGSNPLLKKIAGILLKIKGKVFNVLPPKIFRLLYLREKFDVEIAFIEGEATKIVSGSLNKKAKKLAWVHTDMIKNGWTNYLYKSSAAEGNAYRNFDKIVCVSEVVKGAFIEKFGISDTVCVRYNPVDSADIREKAMESISESAERKPLLVTVGRLEEPKGYPRLVECAAKLRKEGHDFTLWILGDGRQREMLTKSIEENNLSDTVKLLGFHANPYKFISKADAFICSSYIEGFSTAATESVILGKPVYTVDCPGMSELFGDSQCGEIVPNTDEDLYELLKHAVTDRKKMQEYTENAVKRAEFFEIDKRMAEIESLI